MTRYKKETNESSWAQKRCAFYWFELTHTHKYSGKGEWGLFFYVDAAFQLPVKRFLSDAYAHTTTKQHTRNDSKGTISSRSFAYSTMVFFFHPQSESNAH